MTTSTADAAKPLAILVARKLANAAGASRLISAHPKAALRANGFTLVELLVVIAIIGTLVGLLLPAVQAARESARRSACSNNLKQFAMAMQNFHDARGHLPWIVTRTNPPGTETTDNATPSGKTWAVFVWPFIEQADLYNSFNFNVGSNDNNATSPGGPTNLQLTSRRVQTYYCPSDRPNAADSSGQAKWNYLVNSGSNAIINPQGPFGWISGSSWFNYKPCKISFKHITDGISKTLLLGEVRFAATDSPNDSRGAAFNDLSHPAFMTLNTPNSGSDMVGGCNNTADMPCILLSQPPWRFEANNAARSRHVGGVGVAMCDGAVGFIADSIDLSTWRAMSTTRGGETFSNSSF